MTGDGLTHATRRLTTNRNRLAPEETYRLIRAFARSQHQDREECEPSDGRSEMREERPLVQRLHRDLKQLATDYRESL